MRYIMVGWMVSSVLGVCECVCWGGGKGFCQQMVEAIEIPFLPRVGIMMLIRCCGQILLSAEGTSLEPALRD